MKKIDRRSLTTGTEVLFHSQITNQWFSGKVTNIIYTNGTTDVYINRVVFYGLFYEFYENTKKLRTRLLIRGITVEEVRSPNEEAMPF